MERIFTDQAPERPAPATLVMWKERTMNTADCPLGTRRGSKVWTGLLVGAIVVSLIGNLIQYGLFVKQEIHLAMAIDQVETIHYLFKRAHSKHEPMLRSTREGIIEYYPSGTKQVEGSKLDQIVEMVRTHAVEEIDWMLEGEPRQLD